MFGIIYEKEIWKLIRIKADNSNNKKTTTTYENIFVVLSNEEKIEFLNNLENFKSYLSHDTEYTEELKTILLKEFYESERIYLRE